MSGKLTSEQGAEVRDEGDLRRYRTEIPNLILELGLTPYELALYVHLKRTAGGDGLCWKSTDTLARETGMSWGMITKAKEGLLKKFPALHNRPLIILKEESNAHGGKPKHVIKLTDVWYANVKFYGSESAPEGGRSRPSEAAKPSSPHEIASSPHEIASSPHEIASSPHEIAISCGEIKNKPYEEITLEEVTLEEVRTQSTECVNARANSTQGETFVSTNSPPTKTVLTTSSQNLTKRGQSDSPLVDMGNPDDPRFRTPYYAAVAAACGLRKKPLDSSSKTRSQIAYYAAELERLKYTVPQIAAAGANWKLPNPPTPQQLFDKIDSLLMSKKQKGLTDEQLRKLSERMEERRRAASTGA